MLNDVVLNTNLRFFANSQSIPQVSRPLPADAFAAFPPCRAVCLPTRPQNGLFLRKTVPRRHVERYRWPIFRICVREEECGAPCKSGPPPWAPAPGGPSPRSAREHNRINSGFHEKLLPGKIFLRNFRRRKVKRMIQFRGFQQQRVQGRQVLRVSVCR